MNVPPLWTVAVSASVHDPSPRLPRKYAVTNRPPADARDASVPSHTDATTTPQSIASAPQEAEGPVATAASATATASRRAPRTSGSSRGFWPIDVTSIAAGPANDRPPARELVLGQDRRPDPVGVAGQPAALRRGQRHVARGDQDRVGVD